MGYHMMGYHWLWWFALAVLLVWAVTRFTGGQARVEPTAGKSSEEILRDRFAKGEISEEDLREKLQTLRDSHEEAAE
jgi:uncharacterized membrane protein